MKFQLRRREGFTLIELLIVIVIIGILAVGFAPTLLNAPKKARDAVKKGLMGGVQQAIGAYAIDSTTGYPATLSDVAAYYPGGSIPTNVSTAVKYVPPASLTAGKCFWLYVTVEDASSGNATTAPTNQSTCITPSVVASGNTTNLIYYVATPIN